MENIQDKLQQIFPGDLWRVKKASAGESNLTYIADNGKEKVFIKYDVKSEALKRLSELGVTPKVLYDGTNEEKPYIIQEFVEGDYPNASWFSDNLEVLADFIRKYQDDEVLRELLAGGKDKTYAEFVAEGMAYLDRKLAEARLEVFKTNKVNKAVENIKSQVENLKEVSLVPTHADPNIKNFLITEKGLLMLDWDDIGLADPMKDVALILWWYVPKSKWPEFFNRLGKEFDENKLYWWAANQSLMIAVWFGERGDKDNAEFFVEESLLALKKKDNSQMYYKNQNKL